MVLKIGKGLTMETSMRISGELITVGDLVEADLQPVAGVPGFQLRLQDGRIVTISGLNRDEARAAAAHFGDLVSLNLVPAKA